MAPMRIPISSRVASARRQRVSQHTVQWRICAAETHNTPRQTMCKDFVFGVLCLPTRSTCFMVGYCEILCWLGQAPDLLRDHSSMTQGPAPSMRYCMRRSKQAPSPSIYARPLSSAANASASSSLKLLNNACERLCEAPPAGLPSPAPSAVALTGRSPNPSARHAPSAPSSPAEDCDDADVARSKGVESRGLAASGP